MKTKLTQASVRALQYRGGKCVYWDLACTGLGVRVNADGTRLYICRYRIHGRERLGTLGDVRALTLEQARQRVLAARLAALEGRDPFARRSSITFAAATELYIQRHAKPHKKSWAKDADRLAYLCREWGHLPLAAITTDTLQRWHLAHSRGAPYAANRYLELVSDVYKKLRAWGLITLTDPTDGIKHNREAARERWLTADEIKRLMESLDAEPHRLGRAAIRLYLLTGLRKEELTRLTWQMIAEDCRSLSIPETKNGRPLHLPLPDAVASMLQGLREEREPGTSIVFHSYQNPGRPIGIRKLWERVRERANLKDVRLHDLRRTSASILFSAGYHAQQIGRILNHTSIKATDAYTYLHDDVTRAALAVLADEIKK